MQVIRPLGSRVRSQVIEAAMVGVTTQELEAAVAEIVPSLKGENMPVCANWSDGTFGRLTGLATYQSPSALDC